jgi:hypothetical protein
MTDLLISPGACTGGSQEERKEENLLNARAAERTVLKAWPSRRRWRAQDLAASFSQGWVMPAKETVPLPLAAGTPRERARQVSAA